MRIKILKIVFVIVSVAMLASMLLFSASASAVTGFETYQPNMPNMNLIYVSEGYSTPNWRTLTGYYQFGGSKNSSQNAGDNSMRTFLVGDKIGYEFDLYNKAEVYLDFIYLPLKSSSSTAPSNTYYFEYYISGTISDVSATATTDLYFHIYYYDDNFTLMNRRVTLTKTLESNDYHTITVHDLIPSSQIQNVRGIKSISFGFDVSQDYVIDGVFGQFMLSNATDYANYQPYINATANLKNSVYSYAYSKGAADSSTNNADAIYQSGYEAGFNAGSNYGMGSNNTISQATLNYYYQTGYQEGLLVGNNQNALELKNKYNEGYSAGYDEGYALGEEEGYDSGYSDGYDSGYDSGVFDDRDRVYQEGYDVGEEEGYQVGFEDGVSEGWNLGSEAGYIEGYEVGASESIEKMGMFNFVVRSVGSVLNIPLGEHFTLGGILAIVIAIPLLALMLKLFSGGD